MPAYPLAFDEIVAPIVRGFRPDLILVAAGQDASAFDPTGRMLVSAAGFRALAERVAQLADELTGGRLVVSTEGGDSPVYNPFCLLAVLEGLAGESAGIPDPWHDDATVRAARAPPTTASEPPSPRCAAPSRAGFRNDPGWTR